MSARAPPDTADTRNGESPDGDPWGSLVTAHHEDSGWGGVAPAGPIGENRRLAHLRDRVPLRRRRSAAPPPSPRGPRSAFARLDALAARRVAVEWQAWLLEGDRSRADLARHAGVSRARVTQLMSLLAVEPARLEGISIKAGLRLAASREAS